MAVCDRVQERAERAAAAAGAHAYVDFQRMLREHPLDIVAVLTESGSHGEIGAEVAPQVRALIIEKPLALTLDDADRLIECCDRNSTQLFVVKQNRYNPPVQRLRAALERRRFGKLVLGTARVRWCRTQAYYDSGDW